MSSNDEIAHKLQVVKDRLTRLGELEQEKSRRLERVVKQISAIRARLVVLESEPG